MASVAESIGLGATVHINDGASSAYVAVDNLVDFEPPSRKLGTVPSKRLDDGGTDTHVPTRFDPGQSKVNVQMGQAGYARMIGLRDGKTKKSWKFTIPDDTTTTVRIVAGYVVECKVAKVESDKITEYEITVQFTGTESDVMTKADLLAALECKPTPFAGAGVTCHVRPLTIADARAVQAYRDAHGDDRAFEMQVVRAVCDEHGTRLFSDDDAPAVSGWNGGTVNAILARTNELIHVGQDPGKASTPPG